MLSTDPPLTCKRQLPSFFYFGVQMYTDIYILCGSGGRNEMPDADAVRPRLRLRRRRQVQIGRRTRRNASATFLRIYNAHITALTDPADSLDPLPGSRRHSHLRDSTVFGVPWSSAEKESFFKAVSRRGRSNVEWVAEDVGTKSVLEVSAYLHLLKHHHDAILQECKMSKGGPEDFGLLSYCHLPAAVEISDVAVSAEQALADSLAQTLATKFHKVEETRLGWSLVTRDTATVIHREVTMTRKDSDQEARDVWYRTAPDLVLLDAQALLDLQDFFHQRLARHTTTATTTTNTTDTSESIVYRATIQDLYERMGNVTRQLVSAATDLAVSRIKAESNPYFSDERKFKGRNQVAVADVLAACDLLGLKQRISEYWDNLTERTIDCPLQTNATDDDDDNDDDEIVLDDDSESTMIDSEEQHDPLEILLDRYDACASAVSENEYRPFLNISIPRPVPHPLTAKEMKEMQRFGMDERYESE